MVAPAARRRIAPARRLRGRFRLPGDKSLSHRLAILAALAEGTSRFGNFSTAGDCRSTLSCLEALGAQIAVDAEGAVSVTGGGPGALHAAPHPLDAGNSGSTLRMLAGVLAARPFTSVLDGDASLRGPARRAGGRAAARDGRARRHHGRPAPRHDRRRPARGHDSHPGHPQRPGEDGDPARRPAGRRADHGHGARGQPRPHRAPAPLLRRAGVEDGPERRRPGRRASHAVRHGRARRSLQRGVPRRGRPHRARRAACASKACC